MRYSLLLLFLILGCTTPAKRNVTSSSFERFRRLATHVEAKTASPVSVVLTGEFALQSWVDAINQAQPGEQITIRQFYIENGQALDRILPVIENQLRRGVRIHLVVDYVFARGATAALKTLTTYPQFQLEVVRPPSEDLKNLARRKYGFNNLDELILAIRTGDSVALAKQMATTGAVIPTSELANSEVVLASLFANVAKKSNLWSKLALKNNLEEFSKRLHDKSFVLTRKNSRLYNMGGRGWADSFLFYDEKTLNYSDLDFYFSENLASVPNHGQTELTNTLLFLRPTDDEDVAAKYAANQIALIKSAQRKITIYTAYFAPPDEIIEELTTAARRGVQIEVYTNSIESSDFPWAQALAYDEAKRWRSLLGARFKLHTLPKEKNRCFHAKVAIVDDDLLMVSTGNWDPRSFIYDSNSFFVFHAEPDGLLVLKTWLQDPTHLPWQLWGDKNYDEAASQVRAFFGESVYEKFHPMLKDSFVRSSL